MELVSVVSSTINYSTDQSPRNVLPAQHQLSSGEHWLAGQVPAETHQAAPELPHTHFPWVSCGCWGSGNCLWSKSVLRDLVVCNSPCVLFIPSSFSPFSATTGDSDHIRGVLLGPCSFSSAWNAYSDPGPLPRATFRATSRTGNPIWGARPPLGWSVTC